LKNALGLVQALLIALPCHAGDFVLASPEIPRNGVIPRQFEFDGFGCRASSGSPALKWENPPEGARSYAITVFDADAPTGSGWWHWVVVNIPSHVSSLSPDSGRTFKLPPGAMHIRNDFGERGWGGVCPGRGERPHRYVFSVHAIKLDRLPLTPDATAAMASFMINANSLGKASFVATYAR
jgi:hypothetical protein